MKSIYRQARERFLYLYVTNECNLRCKHCYVGNDRLNKSEYFAPEKAREVMEYFKATYGHDKLYILGGEPTKHPQLDKIVDHALACDYSITISSNGDFDDDIFEKIPPHKLASINFSLESSHHEIHTKIRGRKDNYDKVVQNINKASEKGYQVRVMCTVSETNVEQAFDLIPFLADMGVDTLSYHNLGLTGNAKEYLTPLTPEKWMNFCEELETLPPDPRISIYYPPTFIKDKDLSKYADRGYGGCPARTLDRPHVYPDGSVYLCPLLMDDERYFAKFENGRLILNTDPSSELNAYLKIDEICIGCSQSKSCGGGCPAYSNMDAYQEEEWYTCDRKTIPLCILWTTYAWEKAPEKIIHEFR
ncbi:MAG: radical SAM protein [Cyclobacteriaceae bacterium]